jgi:hypothetical protein
LGKPEICRHDEISLSKKESTPTNEFSKKEVETICIKKAQGCKADFATHSGLLSKIILWDEV